MLTKWRSLPSSPYKCRFSSPCFDVSEVRTSPTVAPSASTASCCPVYGRRGVGCPVVARADLKPPGRTAGGGVRQREGLDNHAAGRDQRAAALVGKGLDTVRADGLERRRRNGGDAVPHAGRHQSRPSQKRSVR